MYSEDVYQKLRDWSERTLFLVRSLLPLMTPVAQHPKWTIEQRETLGPLLSASARSGESAFLLTAYGQLWDAEILVRAGFEASLKFAYMLQFPASFETRHHEYRHDHFRIGLLKDHAKIVELLAAVPNPHEDEWRPLRERLLSDAERDEFSAAYPKAARSALETRWGFTGMIRELVKSGDPLFRDFAGFAASYASASHIVHADHIGTVIPLEIDTRHQDRRDAQLKAHAVRLMSDTMASLQVRLAVGYRFIDRDPSPLAEAFDAIHKLKMGFGRVYEDWMATEYGKISHTSM